MAAVPETSENPQAYLIGGGIASLAAAAFLIRDAGWSGENIHILEEMPLPGGSLDGGPTPQRGFVSRGGRMLEEEAYTCLWDLLGSIPTLTDPSVTVLEEIEEFNRTWHTHAHARLIDRDHKIVDAADLGLVNRDRMELARLLALPEHVIGARRIDDFFSPHFFETNFWTMWRTTFAFQNWHSAIELKRYFLRFVQEFPRIHTLSGARRTPLNQYDSIVRPIQKWLLDRGVRIDPAVKTVDADFTTAGNGDRRVTRLHVERYGEPGTYELRPEDYAFLTIGSMTADSSYGDDDTAPELVRDKRDGDWRLWESIARKEPDFGHPEVFSGNVDQAKWESFTLTMRSPRLIDRIQEFSGDAPGTGALMTFKDSPWLMSIVVPHQPHFANQPDNVQTLWGYGLFTDQEGDYVRKKMSQATGQEILTELIGHLGFTGILDEVRATTSVVTVMMPYITSQFAARRVEDRPLVVVRGARNFAFLGQYVEIPGDVVFTVEYSVRGAMHAVYELMGVEREIPGIYHGLSDPKTAFQALKTAFG